MEELLSSATFIRDRRVREHVQPLMYLLSSLCNLGGTLVLNCRRATAWIAVDPTKKILPQAIIAIGWACRKQTDTNLSQFVKIQKYIADLNFIKKIQGFIVDSSGQVYVFIWQIWQPGLKLFKIGWSVVFIGPRSGHSLFSESNSCQSLTNWLTGDPDEKWMNWLLPIQWRW